MRDKDLRATYKFAHGIHFVTVEQWDVQGPHADWKMRTQLFVGNEQEGVKLAGVINECYR